MHLSKNLLIVLISGIPVLGVQAQELTLFEATEEEEQAQNTTVRQPERNQRSSEPAFTLKGNSRFGDNFTASLLSRDGTQVSVDLGTSESAQITGYPDYSIVDITPRSVTLQLPADDPCVEAVEKGVRCSGSLAVLSLANAAPLPPRNPQERPAGNDEAEEAATPNTTAAAGESAQESGQAVLFNPFSGEPQVIPEISEEERQARAERAAARAERLRNFQVNRIAPEDVPEGMRVVSTPFGDRLVPDN